MTTLSAMPAIETPHLVVREFELHDWEAFGDFMMHPGYLRHVTMRFRSDDEIRAFVTRTVARQGDERRNVFHLAAEGLKEGRAIGDGFIIMQRKGVAEIGWGVHPHYWGRGLGTEIGRALMGLAFERLKAERVWAKVMSANEASIKLARRIGLRHSQSHADFPAGNGRFEPVDIFALNSEGYYDLPY